MLKFKFGAWAVVLMLTAFSFSACDDNDDETYCTKYHFFWLRRNECAA